MTLQDEPLQLSELLVLTALTTDDFKAIEESIQLATTPEACGKTLRTLNKELEKVSKKLG